MNIRASFNTIILEEAEPGIAVLRLNRPESLNAMNLEMLDELKQVFSILKDDASVRVVIITGNGRGFCSGADLADAAQEIDSEYFSDPETFLRRVQETYSSVILTMRSLPQPIIAAVNGPAAGGGFCMAMASDIRIASGEAYFVASFINIGLSGGELGSSFLLPRLIGLSRASDILCTGRKVFADEAEQIGLVSRAVPPGELMSTTLAYARMMAAKSFGSLKFTKRALDVHTTAPSLESAIEYENRNQTMLLFSGDFARLIQSFSPGSKKTSS